MEGLQHALSLLRMYCTSWAPNMVTVYHTSDVLHNLSSCILSGSLSLSSILVLHTLVVHPYYIWSHLLHGMPVSCTTYCPPLSCMLWDGSIVFVVLCTPTPGIPHLVHTPWVVSVLHPGMDTLTLYLYPLWYYSLVHYTHTYSCMRVLPYTLALLALRQTTGTSTPVTTIPKYYIMVVM